MTGDGRESIGIETVMPDKMYGLTGQQRTLRAEFLPSHSLKRETAARQRLSDVRNGGYTIRRKGRLQ